jgi:hypothetical protein
MLPDLKNLLRRNLVNLKGRSLKTKFIVFESDDWGSIRMPNKYVFNQLKKRGYAVDNNPYTRFDTLATKEDLSALFETLGQFEDNSGKHPVFTANTIVANPIFEKIEQSGFTEYSYESFIKTLSSYYSQSNAFDIWQEGIREGLFYPQFHGREHLNVPLWMKLLKEQNPEVLEAFYLKCWGLKYGQKFSYELQAPYDVEYQNDVNVVKTGIKEGLKLFEEIFGYQSRSIIAGNYIWNSSLHKTMFVQGIRYIQGMKYQLLPQRNSGGKKKKIRHYVGEKNRYGQTFLIRNCVFEPSLYPSDQNHVENCLKDIENAFLWKKPAIITTHRLNYIGALCQKNRDVNLKKLKQLLREVKKRWPEVEFLTSDKLGEIVASS